MQRRLEDWVEKHVCPDRLFKVNTQDVNSGLFDEILGRLQALLKCPGLDL
jgi:hypothetical protein